MDDGTQFLLDQLEAANPYQLVKQTMMYNNNIYNITRYISASPEGQIEDTPTSNFLNAGIFDIRNSSCP